MNIIGADTSLTHDRRQGGHGLTLQKRVSLIAASLRPASCTENDFYTFFPPRRLLRCGYEKEDE